MICIEQLRFGYPKAPLYRDFNLTLATPGLYGLFGRNGSGKSTLLKLIAGLLFPHAGRVHVAGREPRLRHPETLANLYLVPEEFHLPNLSGERLARLQAGFYPRFSRSLFDEALEVFALDPLASFDTMSLGGKKKAVLAFALATLTPVLLLDEPTNGLDIVARDQFRQLLRHPAQAERIVIISTHQAHDLEQVISNILFIENGTLALSSSMDVLSKRLRMGIAEAAEVAALEHWIYQEAIGAQMAFIARHDAAQIAEPVQLELLYRALCRAPDRVLAALAAREHEDV